MNAESTRNLDEILSTEQLEAFQSRVARYDENNEFFQEDFDVMKESGYLIQAVPEELGGLGLSFAEVCQQQRRLAYYAPADALAINMHVYWTGVAADLWRSGDNSLEYLANELFLVVERDQNGKQAGLHEAASMMPRASWSCSPAYSPDIHSRVLRLAALMAEIAVSSGCSRGSSRPRLRQLFRT